MRTRTKTPPLLVFSGKRGLGALEVTRGVALGRGGQRADEGDLFAGLNALERRYETDAHCVTYSCAAGAPQPRIRKDGLEAVRGAGLVPMMRWVFVDLDLPGKRRSTPEDIKELRRRFRFANSQLLQRAGIYQTRHGARLVWPLLYPKPVDEAERRLRRLLERLHEQGVHCDDQCCDWTRYYRLPRVRRGGQDEEPILFLERMKAIDLDWYEPLDSEIWRGRKRAREEARRSGDPASEWQRLDALDYQAIDDATYERRKRRERLAKVAPPSMTENDWPKRLQPIAQIAWQEFVEKLESLEAGHDLGLGRGQRLNAAVFNVARLVSWRVWTPEQVESFALSRVEGLGIEDYEERIRDALHAGMGNPRALPHNRPRRIRQRRRSAWDAYLK